MWTFELGLQSGVDVPIYVMVGFLQRHQLHQRQRNNDTVYRPTVVNAQCKISIEKYSDEGMNCTYVIDKNSKARGKIVSCFRPLAKDKI